MYVYIYIYISPPRLCAAGMDVHGRVTEWNLKLAELSFVSKEEAPET